MSPLMIVQLLIALGPPALQLIQDLVSVWNTPALTVDQVMEICKKSQKSYDDYIADAKAVGGVTVSVK